MAPIASSPGVRRLPRSHPIVRKVARTWRELTGGGRDRDHQRRTLIACSGGADSSALVVALASAMPVPRSVPRPSVLRPSPGSDGDGRADPPFVIAHVVHDLRPRPNALADRDAAKALADSLGLPFAEAEVRIRTERGNPESIARRLRYTALKRLATAHNCPYIATAHHADDQLETMLMALLRGSGPRGLAGIAQSRPLGASTEHPEGTPDLRSLRRRSGLTACSAFGMPDLSESSSEGPGQTPHAARDAGPEWSDLPPVTTLIRPMLDITRADAERICIDAAWTWREDATNQDRSRLRNALRHEVLPALRRIRPRAAHHAVEAARLLADAADLIRDRAAQHVPRPSVPRPSPGSDGDGRAVLTWPRDLLRAQPPAVLGELLRLAAAHLLRGQRRDRIGLKRLAPALRAVRACGTDPRSFTWSGVVLDVTARTITLRADGTA